MPWNVYVLIFALVQQVVPLCLQWPLAQLFPATWTGSMLSLSFFDVYGTAVI